ncbi:MAG TPA: hypothetical protein VN200_02930 [Rhodoglobus sp.]|nr:hypothetical protein [Rhodoglobus sp.]
MADDVAAVRWHARTWVRILAIFVASRVVTTTIMLVFAAQQQANAWTGARPGYFDFARLWDAHWYYIIAVAGYPPELPMTDDGHVGESAWAFMPVYPAIVRALMFATGAPFSVVAVLVSVAAAAGAAFAFHRLLRLHLPEGSALFGVALFCFAPLSPILQVGYAESLHLLLLTVALILLVERRYWALLPVIAVMALTRPSGLAFALTMLLHVGWRWWRRRDDPFPLGERIASVTAGLFSAVMGVAWLLIAAAVTGSLTAYLDTELAWRSSYIGYGELAPFAPWIQGALWWADWWGLPAWLLVVVLGLAVVGFSAALFTPPFRRLGVDLRFWLVSYALYLLAVFFPQSSTPRLLLPTFPLFGAVAQPASIVYRVGIVLLFILGQVGWVHIAWWADGVDWTPP